MVQIKCTTISTQTQLHHQPVFADELQQCSSSTDLYKRCKEFEKRY